MRALTSLRRRTTALLTGLLAAALVLSGCSVYDAPLPGGPDVGDDPMKVTVMFRDVLDLVPQSTVKVDDVTVGKVTAVTLKGYVAKVTLELPKDVDLPDNATAQIRQTSLLGEKFVDLSEPRDPSSAKLADGAVIGLSRTGRNPEVEEVFGALALLLNGGGVGQLKTIYTELNTAFDGRESEVKSVLDQIRVFTTVLDDNKSAIIQALENTNRLAVQLRKQRGTIESALDDIPGALASVNRQRDDLVKLLKALTRLSDVGVRVISASKESTINSLRDLAPVLEGFAKAGQNLPKAFQVYLTYPFVDEAVGRDPQVARNLHMGDYTNLSVDLDIDTTLLDILPDETIPVPAPICAAVQTAREYAKTTINALPLSAAQKQQIRTIVLAQIEDDDCNITTAQVQAYIAAALAALGGVVTGLVCPTGSTNPLCDLLTDPSSLPTITIPQGLPDLAGGLGGLTGQNNGQGNGLGGVLPRAAVGEGFQQATQIDPFGLQAKGYDPGVGTLLFQGVATQR